MATLEQAGYKEPTELQRQLIPLIKAKKNVLVKSQSASGKTGAFLIPAINYVLENPLDDYHGARILILTSRKDRVNQIKYTVKKLATNQEFRFGFIVSGRPYQPQMRLLRRPLDIMVATPGRLSDLSDNGKADFSQLEMLIVDDLASIYHKEFHALIDKILSQRSEEYPIVLFVRDDVDVLNYANSLIPDAIELELEEDKHPLTKIPQVLHLCDDYTHKIAIMDYLLDEYQGEPTLIYTSSEKAATHLADNLANHGHSADLAAALSVEEQKQSTILIASDEKLATLAFYDYQHVINFELPKSTTSYCARLEGKEWEGRESAVISLLGIQEREALQKIEELLGIAIEQKNVPGLEPLNPFSTFKPTTSNSGSPQAKKEGRPQKRRNTGQFGKRRGADQRKNHTSNDNKNQKRNKKGRFGRLSGGIHRKREETSNKTSAPTNNTGKKIKPSNARNQTGSALGTKKKITRNKPNVNFKKKYDNKWSDEGRGSAFPVIKNPQDVGTQNAVDESKVVVRFKGKKLSLKQKSSD